MSTYVSLQVPEALYGEMLDHLASVMAEARAEPRMLAEPTTAAAGRADRVWSEDDWQNVWPILTDGTRKIILLLARHQGEWVPISALEDSLGSFGAVQGALISFTKRVKKRGGPSMWPFEVEVTDEETGRARYQMNEEAATIVLGLAQHA